MGNTLKQCFRGEDEEAGHFHGRRGRYPYYQPQQYYYGGGGPYPHPPAASAPQQVQVLGPDDIVALFTGASALTQAADPNTGHQQRRSNGVRRDSGVVASQYQSNTEDIDESSAEGLCSAKSYAKANPLLVQVHVLGTTKKFWRMSDRATRISRKLALILRSHHAVGKHLAAPLQLSNVWIGGGESGVVVKLRGVSFTDRGFCIERVRNDYRQLSRLLQGIIRVSSSAGGGGGDGGATAIARLLPPDYREFLALLGSDALSTDADEFLIVNSPALLPMKNRTEAFLALHDRIVKHLGRTDRAKKRRILAGLPYEEDWLDTATANARINQWVVNCQNAYRRTPADLLRLNRNVRSHLHEYGDDGGILDDGDDCCTWKASSRPLALRTSSASWLVVPDAEVEAEAEQMC